MRFRRLALAIAILLVLVIGGFVWWSQEKLIVGIEPPSAAAFDPAIVERGARLAAIGNCDICHTIPGGSAYSGGRSIPTPFGTVYSSNITPAPGSGLGRWSEEAFRRALRDGVSRRGEHLYPAFPYDHYAKLTDDDIRALYAFIMTRAPVETARPANQLRFPFGQRWLMAFWNLLFLDRTPFRPDPTQSAEWNRGAYLVAGLGHCGDCHTPRNLLGGEKTAQALSGGTGEGWRAPALNAASPAPMPWEEAQLFAYLSRGWDADHGTAAGPMQAITEDMARANDADLRAIATYLAASQGETSPSRPKPAQAGASPTPKPAAGEEEAAAIFAGACAGCHTGASPMVPPHGIPLARSSVVNDADPRDAILILLDGIRPDGERAGPSMPSFDGAFTDAQIVGLLRYIRAHDSSGPAWTDIETRLRDIRDGRKR